MKASDKAKIGLAAVGVGIVGYGLYSMKRDTEKLLEGPANFLGGLFGPDSVLGGGGLPEGDTDNLKKLLNYPKSFLGGLFEPDGGLGKNKEPEVNQWTEQQRAGLSYMSMLYDSIPNKPTGTIFETSKEPVTMSAIREMLDVNVPSKYLDSLKTSAAVNPFSNFLGPSIPMTETKYIEKTTTQKIQESGMPSSNLNKGTVVGTERDKTGVERIIIKYDNGVTMRY